MLIYEVLGYIASLLVALSLMMRSVFKLRVINLVGAIAFTVYGLVIGAYPVAAVNFFIIIIDLYYLREMLAAKPTEYFHLLEIKPQSEYLTYFLNFYRSDIQRYWPGFEYRPNDRDLSFFVLRNNVPAGLFMAESLPEGALLVKLDFVTPEFRDYKIGQFVYSDQAGFFRDHHISLLLSQPGNSELARYLKRMGFVPQPGTPANLLMLLSQG